MASAKKVNWSKLIKTAKSNWKKGKEAKKNQSSGGFANLSVENGKYLARLVNMEASGDGKAVFEQFKITEGECKGEKVKNRQGLDNSRGLGYFMANLEKLGYETPELDEMQEALPEILDEINEKHPHVRITVKNTEKDGVDYQNVYIDKLLSDDEEADGTEEREDVAGDDDEVELSVGMEVVATIDGEEIEGTIVKILADKGQVRIKDEDGDKHLVDADDVAMPESDDEESDDVDDEQDEDDADESDDNEEDDEADEEDEDEDEEEDEDDDEEEEEPPIKRPRKKAVVKKATRKPAKKKKPVRKAKAKVTKKKGSIRRGRK